MNWARVFPGLSEYFVFDKQKYTLEEFFSDIKTFKVSHPSISIIDAHELIAATVGKLRRVRWIFF